MLGDYNPLLIAWTCILRACGDHNQFQLDDYREYPGQYADTRNRSCWLERSTLNVHVRRSGIDQRTVVIATVTNRTRVIRRHVVFEVRSLSHRERAFFSRKAVAFCQRVISPFLLVVANVDPREPIARARASPIVSTRRHRERFAGTGRFDVRATNVSATDEIFPRSSFRVDIGRTDNRRILVQHLYSQTVTVPSRYNEKK